MPLNILKRLFLLLCCFRFWRGYRIRGRRAALFDARFYRESNAGILTARLFPFLHFMLVGGFEGRRPHPLFDTAYYLDRNPDVRESGVNPLLHYVLHGAAEGRKPHPLFDPAHYLRGCPEAANSGLPPLLHFLTAAAPATNPHQLFDCSAYLRQHPDVAAQRINPAVHYLRSKSVSAFARPNSFRFVVLHYHIFKNAGMTVDEILDRNFGDRLCRLDGTHRNDSIPNSGLLAFLDRNPYIEAMSSHQIRYPVPAAPGYVFLDVCFLRDPIDRIRSIYDYLRKKPIAGDPISEIAARMPLPDFMGHLLEHMPHRITNIHVNFLANGGSGETPGPDDLRRATEVMRNVSILGVVDRFAESFQAAKYLLQPVYPHFEIGLQPTNVTGGLSGTLEERKAEIEEACGTALYAQLVECNRLDLELLERARAEVERRLQLSVRTPAPVAIDPLPFGRTVLSGMA